MPIIQRRIRRELRMKTNFNRITWENEFPQIPNYPQYSDIAGGIGDEWLGMAGAEATTHLAKFNRLAKQNGWLDMSGYGATKRNVMAGLYEINLTTEDALELNRVVGIPKSSAGNSDKAKYAELTDKWKGSKEDVAEMTKLVKSHSEKGVRMPFGSWIKTKEAANLLNSFSNLGRAISQQTGSPLVGGGQEEDPCITNPSGKGCGGAKVFGMSPLTFALVAGLSLAAVGVAVFFALKNKK